MRAPAASTVDLTPPDFAEGLDDWSAGDGTPGSRSYDTLSHARIATGDADFGTCLEMRKVEAVQRLRYMAELPIPTGSFVEIHTRAKALRGPLPGLRIAALPGGLHGRAVADLPQEGPVVLLRRHAEVLDLSAIIGPVACPGVDFAWDGRVLYAHVGLDLVGQNGAVLRIERFFVRDVSARYR